VRYVADHHISPRTVAPLKARGFDIYRVSDVLPRDAADLQILALARAEGRTVLSQDLDYSALLASTGSSQPSVVCPIWSYLNRAIEDADDTVLIELGVRDRRQGQGKEKCE
jgi:predicted nuclease of predicted toxin-antitoxin system